VLNGEVVGKTRNMLVEHDFDVSSLLAWGQRNVLTIRIESSMNKARAREYPVHLFGNESHDEMVALRMPAHSFGWDIMPRFLSGGIWRPISIQSRPRERLTDVYYATTKLSAEGAELTIRYRFHSAEPEIAGYSVRVRGKCKSSSFEKTVIARFVSGGFVVHIAEPALWWPRGYGEPNLYSVELSLLKKAMSWTRGASESASEKPRSKDGMRRRPGEFRILVNDSPVMAMGSNWVPLDAFHSRDAGRLSRAFELVNDWGCNILRAGAAMSTRTTPS